MTSLEPIPETADAIDNLDAFADEGELLTSLTWVGGLGRKIVLIWSASASTGRPGA